MPGVPPSVEIDLRQQLRESRVTAQRVPYRGDFQVAQSPLLLLVGPVEQLGRALPGSGAARNAIWLTRMVFPPPGLPVTISDWRLGIPPPRRRSRLGMPVSKSMFAPRAMGLRHYPTRRNEGRFALSGEPPRARTSRSEASTFGDRAHGEGHR